MKSDKSSDHLEDYVLSKSLVSADGDAVRSMCLMETAPTDDTSNTNKLLVMGSQSGWITTYSINTTYEQIHSFQGGHSHAITALVSYEKNKFVSGCKDSIIRVFDMSDADNTDNITQLVGHTNAVTSFSLVYFSSSSSTTKPFLLSGSWDGTAKLWNDDTTCLTTLEGHENTVCVQGLPPSSSTTTSSSVLPSNNNNYYYYATVVTGSAGIAYGNVISEMKIRLWDITLVDSTTTNYKPTTSCTATLRACITDHLGPIRGLCYNPINHYFASISNDGSLKLRDCSTGTTVQSFQHSTNTSNDEPPLLLTVTTLGNGIYITGTEDGYAYVWNTTGITSNTPQQIILHPNTIWQVLPYSTSTATTTTTSNNEEDEEDFMTACHDGYVRIFTKSIQRMATPEELTTFTTQVQTATAARSGSDAGGGGGGPSMEEILKLPHWENRHQKVGTSEGQIQLFQKQQEEEGTPYAIAAQWCSGTWIEVGQVVGSDQRQKEVIDGVPYDHVIPIEVDTSTSGTLHLQIGYNTGDNPFVVAQEFIDRHQLEQHYLAQIADYIRERTSPKKPTFLDNPSLQKPKQQHSTAKTLEYLPTKSFLLFDSGTEKSTMNKIVSKVKEIHSSTTNNNSSNELLLLDRLVTTICATNRYHTSTVSKEELLLLSHWISTWPLEHIFPVLDLTRLVVLHPDASNMHNVDFWQQGKYDDVFLSFCTFLLLLIHGMYRN